MLPLRRASGRLRWHCSRAVLLLTAVMEGRQHASRVHHTIAGDTTSGVREDRIGPSRSPPALPFSSLPVSSRRIKSRLVAPGRVWYDAPRELTLAQRQSNAQPPAGELRAGELSSHAPGGAAWTPP